jgi:hypothetical protein
LIYYSNGSLSYLISITKLRAKKFRIWKKPEKIRRSEKNQKNVQTSETFLVFQKIWPPCLCAMHIKAKNKNE